MAGSDSTHVPTATPPCSTATTGSPRLAGTPARAVNRGATTSARHSTAPPPASRTPDSPPPSAAVRPLTSPSTTATPRAASSSRSSAVSRHVWASRVTRSLQFRHSRAWCTASGPVASTAMGRSRTSQPWQYGQCSTSRPQRSRSPGSSGSSSTSPVATSSRPARTTEPSAHRTRNPPSAARSAAMAAAPSRPR